MARSGDVVERPVTRKRLAGVRRQCAGATFRQTIPGLRPALGPGPVLNT
jgi:hypothetical protein